MHSLHSQVASDDANLGWQPCSSNLIRFCVLCNLVFALVTQLDTKVYA
ncbi:hypothetical protein VST7929_00583 [Vibrio stylophorae]|uniref:Uncharacterized protein n=1 Tax=Vibrio stylophorae TaxID=659351 RepID=A0ABM8ZR44_9VIBR|nr:hypothetical protein VST7929_00583 [Vibrio stylophorae]